MLQGVKHLIQCHCILPQFRRLPEPVFHQFAVFSVLENEKVRPKLAQCGNCGVLHKVVDICVSEVASGKDELSTLIGIEDISLSLPDKVCEILHRHECDLPTWEHAQFIFEEEVWNEKIKLTSDTTPDDNVIAKFLLIKSSEKFTITTESSQNFIGNINEV